MRKLGILTITLILMASLFLSACGTNSSSGADSKSNEKMLNIFNWSEYLPESVIQKFEKETGIKVNYTTFSSNEEMYAKLSSGNLGYDIAVPTLFFIEMLAKEDMLEKINKDNIPNLKNLDPDFTGTFADPNDEFTVPYLWGSVVIAVNKEIVKKGVKGYDDLFDPEFKNSLVMPEDNRASIGAMLAIKGYPINNTDVKQIEEAGEMLKKLKPNIKAFDGDNPKGLLITGEAKAGIMYSAEAALAKRENPNIEIIFPKEASFLWQDNFVIPKGAPHKENAEKFIDFVLRPEISKEISEAYPYGNPNKEAVKLLSKEIQEEMSIPKDFFERSEYARDVGETTVLYDRIWTEVKQ
ncbi:ABC transporter substrate-binding protein [Siminovitchia terrae]|uniref:ABC transporter substrate-binding protein n=1 Tax=Siminovitchia terrae TaxID=1914933 RepID=UPI0028AF5C76|nr:spermidine/putrescine ABC transporter substrate-binding protein [Siminovitchia terrae]